MRKERTVAELLRIEAYAWERYLRCVIHRASSAAVYDRLRPVAQFWYYVSCECSAMTHYPTQYPKVIQ